MPARPCRWADNSPSKRSRRRSVPTSARPMAEGLVRYVKLSVADNGLGMSEDTMSRIFDPFFTTKTDAHHPGLGLSMCRGIIEQSGGHITVRSLEGHGTVFNLFLPSVDAV